MLQCSLSQLIRLGEIMKTEQELYEHYISAANSSTDSGVKEKLQKCAAIHKANCNTLRALVNK